MNEEKNIRAASEVIEDAAARSVSELTLGNADETNAILSEQAPAAQTLNEPLDANVKTLSPFMLVMKRFFRSRLSMVGLTLIILLFLFSFLGPVIFNRWGETQTDYGGKEEIISVPVTVTDADGNETEIIQVTVAKQPINTLSPPSLKHWLGTDKAGMDVFTRIMYGGRISLTISILVVLLETVIGVILGGLAGYFGKWVDQVIMRIVDIFSCVPTLPLLLIAGSLLDAWKVDPSLRIYYLMVILTFLGWAGTARIVRGQILYLREQEYMVAAEAMGLSTARKIFKHLVPNVMPQLIVSKTLGLGSTILYEASLSYLGLGVKAPYAAWGTMINIITEDVNVLQYNPWVWVPSGVLIVLAVLAFNFIGDGLRDALDPKMKR